MYEDEIIGQRRYFSSTGTAPATCERCGIPLAEADATALTGSATYGDPDEPARLCPDCRDLIAKGLEPVELADDDER